MSALRLDLIVRRYNEASGERGVAIQHDRWTWRLWSGSRIVSTSGTQLYSRRVDCARGAEVGAGVSNVAKAIKDGGTAIRYTWAMSIGGAPGHMATASSAQALEWARKQSVEVRILDERDA